MTGNDKVGHRILSPTRWRAGSGVAASEPVGPGPGLVNGQGSGQMDWNRWLPSGGPRRGLAEVGEWRGAGGCVPQIFLGCLN